MSQNNVRLVCGPEGSPNFCFGLEDIATGRSILFVQTDWDYPSLAQNLGWSLQEVQKHKRRKCEHDGTDGTVTCEACGLSARDFITAAYDWLYDHDGDEFECSEYHTEDEPIDGNVGGEGG